MSHQLYSGPLTDELWAVLKRAWKIPISLQCDFARQHAQEIALAASQGWISVTDPDGRAYRRAWRITQGGLTALQYKEHFAS